MAVALVAGAAATVVAMAVQRQVVILAAVPDHMVATIPQTELHKILVHKPLLVQDIHIIHRREAEVEQILKTEPLGQLH
jgi:hypothetical protein